MSREILLLRHGMTAGNRLRQYIGRTDQPLCPEGRAELAGLHYPPAALVYVSPLRRCGETAALLFPGAALRVSPDLREMDFGVFEGKSFQTLSGDSAYQAWLDTNCESPIPGGECKADFSRRCCAAFEEILAADAAPRLTFVVHGGTIMSVLEHFAAPRRDYYDWHTGNGRGFLLQTEGDGPAMTLLREV